MEFTLLKRVRVIASPAAAIWGVVAAAAAPIWGVIATDADVGVCLGVCIAAIMSRPILTYVQSPLLRNIALSEAIFFKFPLLKFGEIL